MDDLKITPSSEEYASAYVEFLCEKLSLEISEVPKHIYDEINKIRTCYVLNNNNLQRMIENSSSFFHADVKVKPNVIQEKSKSSDSSKSAFKDPKLREIFTVRFFNKVTWWVILNQIGGKFLGNTCFLLKNFD